ncbi:MAG: hypothetical protein AABY27_03110 [Pseudomonadota bacterium]
MIENFLSTRITFKDSIKIILYYAIIIGILMFINTVFLHLGDPKFGKSGWLLYWPVWGIPYSIPVIFNIIFSRLFKLDRKISNIVCYVEIFIISLIIEACWIFNLDSLGISAILLSIISLTIIFATLILFLKLKLTNIKHILLFMLVSSGTVASAYYYFIFDADRKLSLWNEPADSSEAYIIAVKYGDKCTFDEAQSLIWSTNTGTASLAGILDQGWRGTGYLRLYYKNSQGINVKIVEEQLKSRLKKNADLVKTSKECKVAIVDDKGYFALLN